MKLSTVTLLNPDTPLKQFINQGYADKFKLDYDKYKCYAESDKRMYVYTFQNQNVITPNVVKQLANNFERLSTDDRDRPAIISNSLNSSHNLSINDLAKSNMLGFGIETRTNAPIVNSSSGTRFRPKEDINDIYQNMINTWSQFKNAVLAGGSITEKQSNFRFAETLQNEINDLAKQVNMEPFCPSCKKSLA